MKTKTNLGSTERWLSVGSGLLLMRKGASARGLWGIARLLLGAVTAYRGLRGVCPAKRRLQAPRNEPRRR